MGAPPVKNSGDMGHPKSSLLGQRILNKKFGTHSDPSQTMLSDLTANYKSFILLFIVFYCFILNFYLKYCEVSNNPINLIPISSKQASPSVTPTTPSPEETEKVNLIQGIIDEIKNNLQTQEANIEKELKKKNNYADQKEWQEIQDRKERVKTKLDLLTKNSTKYASTTISTKLFQTLLNQEASIISCKRQIQLLEQRVDLLQNEINSMRGGQSSNANENQNDVDAIIMRSFAYQIKNEVFLETNSDVPFKETLKKVHQKEFQSEIAQCFSEFSEFKYFASTIHELVVAGVGASHPEEVKQISEGEFRTRMDRYIQQKNETEGQRKLMNKMINKGIDYIKKRNGGKFLLGKK